MHHIRLRGPWEYAWSGDRDAPEFDTAELPASWRDLFGERSGTVLFRRRFNRPTNLASEQPVRVVFSRPGGEVLVRLNGHPMDAKPEPGGRVVCDVTEHLAEFNLLEVELTCDPAESSDIPCGLWQPVLLEIAE